MNWTNRQFTNAIKLNDISCSKDLNDIMAGILEGLSKANFHQDKNLNWRRIKEFCGSTNSRLSFRNLFGRVNIPLWLSRAWLHPPLHRGGRSGRGSYLRGGTEWVKDRYEVTKDFRMITNLEVKWWRISSWK